MEQVTPLLLGSEQRKVMLLALGKLLQNAKQHTPEYAVALKLQDDLRKSPVSQEDWESQIKLLESNKKFDNRFVVVQVSDRKFVLAELSASGIMSATVFGRITDVANDMMIQTARVKPFTKNMSYQDVNELFVLLTLKRVVPNRLAEFIIEHVTGVQYEE